MAPLPSDQLIALVVQRAKNSERREATPRSIWGSVIMLTDRYGLALSTASPIARDAYVEGCSLVLTLYPGAVAAFDRAIAADPGFALAHAGRARALHCGSDIAGAQAAIAAAQALASGLPARDASHIEVFSQV